MIIIRTFKIPRMDSANEAIMIFISGFLEMILKGRKVLNIFRIERSIPKLISMTAVTIMKKSSFDQLLFR